MPKTRPAESISNLDEKIDRLIKAIDALAEAMRKKGPIGLSYGLWIELLEACLPFRSKRKRLSKS